MIRIWVFLLICTPLANLVSASLGFGTSAGSLYAQQAESLPITLDEYLNAIRLNHPTARRIQLLDDRAAASLRRARGAFDPNIGLDYRDKQFDDIRYYQEGEAGLRLPTTIGGLELQTGFRWANGVLLNPENKQPSVGQSFLGFELPLLSGLMTDEARTGLARAQLLEQRNEQTAREMTNELLYKGTVAYLDWAYSNRQVQLLRQAIDLTQVRLQQTIVGFEAGDLAAIDTLETYTQLTGREAELFRAESELANARLMVEARLWADDGILQILPNGSLPQALTELSAQPQLAASWQVAQLVNHPKLIQLQLQQQDLNLEARLKRQKLLPKLNLKYQFLARGTDFASSAPSNGESTSLTDVLLQDNAWGIGFAFPILQRRARGDLALTQIKQEETELYLRQTRRELENGLEAIQAQLALRARELNLWQRNVGAYRRLLEAELIDFELGESTVFILNSRENKLLEAELKLAKARFEMLKLQAAQRYLMGAWQ
ncbi:MAG: TolC family protein [Bacteroidota bacterium]